MFVFYFVFILDRITCWERAVPLAFRSCRFYNFYAVSIVCVPFSGPLGGGRMWNSIVSVPVRYGLGKSNHLVLFFDFICFTEDVKCDRV